MLCACLNPPPHDLKDHVANRPPIGRIAFKKRVVSLLKSKKANEVAANCFKGLRKVCQEIEKKKGGASRG
jgi:hypothetical protein